ncbi:NAD(P)H-dependent glycerol-3-phosphate dehydrogenase [Fusibacter sp. JL298sf-3]
MKVTVIAAGSWGTALALVLNENGHDVCLWSKDAEQVATIRKTRLNDAFLKGVKIPESLYVTADLKEALAHAEVFVFAMPSQFFSSVLEACIALDAIKDDTVLINVSKGIDMKRLMTPSQIKFELLGNKGKFVTLSGPSHAEEVAQKLPTALVSASTCKKTAELVQDLFSNAYMRIYTNPDVLGVEVSGALKNIIALGAGISDGLGYGDNAKAALITRGINEIAKLGVDLGAHMETFRGLAGVGDMIVTCTSMHSRNRRCGIMIGEGKTLDEAIETVGMVVEGAYTVKAAYALMQQRHIEMPIVSALYKVLYENKNAREAVQELMMRSRKHEIDEHAKPVDGWC